MGKKIYKLKKIFAKTIGWAYAAFGLSLVIIMLLSWLYYRQYAAVSQYSAEVEQTYKTISDIHSFSSHFKDMQIARQVYLLTGDTGYQHVQQRLMRRTTGWLDSLSYLSRGNTGMQQQVARLRSLTASGWQTTVDSGLLPGISSLHASAMSSLERNRCIADSVQLLVTSITQRQLQLLHQRNIVKENYQSTAPRVLAIVLGVFTCILIVSFLFIVVEMRKRMRYQLALESSNYTFQANNEELGQMAKVISHDLQEPLRKIRTFSNRLVLKYHDQLSTDVRLLLGRMDESVIRMQGLVEDLMNYISLSSYDEQPATVLLNNVWSNVLLVLQPEIAAKDALVTVEPLEKLTAYEPQLLIAFVALLENALKFSRPGTRPLIKISGMQVNTTRQPASLMTGRNYYVVRIEDNGIGFNNQFSEKIFEIFQRLHTGEQEFEGKGIGLAIVQKVMHNHHGYVTATGSEQNGAVFFLYFPV